MNIFSQGKPKSLVAKLNQQFSGYGKIELKKPGRLWLTES